MDHEEIYLQAVERLLQMHFESKVGHIGGNLSVLHILIDLYHGKITENDFLVLSKGHAAGALYIALWTKGIIKDDQLKLFHKDHTKLAGHPAPNAFESIPFATGSLGHGFSLAAGMAHGKKLRNEPGNIYCVTSDGEWNEGSTWEALLYSIQQNLNNLVVIVDVNGLQGFGSTKEVSGINDLDAKLKEFSIDLVKVDGHSWKGLEQGVRPNNKRPKIVLANTIKGKGISFMENKMEWHYLPMTESQYLQAIQELNKQRKISNAS